MKPKTHNISKDKNYSCAVFSAIFACKIREATSILTERAALLSRSLNRAERERAREREGGVCALWKQDLALVRKYGPSVNINYTSTFISQNYEKKTSDL